MGKSCEISVKSLYVFTGLACLLSTVFVDGTTSQGLALSAVVSCGLMTIVITVLLALYLKYVRRSSRDKVDFYFVLGLFTAGMVFVVLSYLGRRHYIGFAGLIVLGILACLIWMSKRMDNKKIILFLFVAAFFVRLIYIIITRIGIRQNDVYPDSSTGHYAYIKYFYDGGSIFFDFDPQEKYQFYHPPLWYMLAALWVRIQTTLGFSYDRAFEGVQLLSLFFSMGVVITVFDILKKFNLSPAALICGFSVIAFYPADILMGGSINNDAMAVFFMFLAFDIALRWYYSSKMSDAVALALVIGIGMSSKLSAAICAFPIAFLMLVKLAKTKEKKKTFLQLLLFGVICVPLGLWWTVLNIVRWDMPLGYIPTPGENLSVANYSLIKRVIDIFPFGALMVYKGHFEYDPAGEFNMFSALVKTSLYGEFRFFIPYDDNWHRRCGYFLCVCLYRMNIINLVMSFFAGLAAFFKGSTLKIKDKVSYKIPSIRIAFSHDAAIWFVELIFIVNILSYIKMNLDYPYWSTMNFRYTEGLMLVRAVNLALLVEWLLRKKQKGAAIFAGLFIFAYCAFSVAVYIYLGR